MCSSNESPSCLCDTDDSSRCDGSCVQSPKSERKVYVSGGPAVGSAEGAFCPSPETIQQFPQVVADVEAAKQDRQSPSSICTSCDAEHAMEGPLCWKCAAQGRKSPLEAPALPKHMPFMGSVPHDAEVLCPNCNNPAHLHTGSGVRDCMANLRGIITTLLAEHGHTDNCELGDACLAERIADDA